MEHKPEFKLKYKLRSSFATNVGFSVNAQQIAEGVALTNNVLGDLPSTLYRSLDFKTISAIIGSIFCDALASQTDGIINPIEKGHPDIVPPEAENASEAQLRNYKCGLEIKCTVGNVEQGANLRAGVKRISRLTGITWQAHHREVEQLMGVTWDFANEKEKFSYPAITGVFYTDKLCTEDWGTISGTTGRNTKVTGMRSSGKNKMGEGWIMLLNHPEYLLAFQRLLEVRLL
jgi:hypothetical protein